MPVERELLNSVISSSVVVQVKMHKASHVCFKETGMWSSEPDRSATEISEIFIRALWEPETFILWEIRILREGGIELRWNGTSENGGALQVNYFEPE